jgi:hypothetical protein
MATQLAADATRSNEVSVRIASILLCLRLCASPSRQDIARNPVAQFHANGVARQD